MNGKIVKELRRKAHNQWISLKPEYQKLFTVRQIYQQMKDVYKTGVKIKDISL